jgi:hypothetical protein
MFVSAVIQEGASFETDLLVGVISGGGGGYCTYFVAKGGQTRFDAHNIVATNPFGLHPATNTIALGNLLYRR